MNISLSFFSHQIILVALLVLLHAGTASANAPVVLAAGERAPYIGEALQGKGYAAELATEAFKRRGYDVKIAFYPLARASMLAGEGVVDGMLPVFRAAESSSEAAFVYSNPFPGDTIGFLKKKTLPFSYSQADLARQDVFLRSLGKHWIGTVRGGPALALIDKNPSLNKEMVSKDLINLDKLALDRIQLALIDKYTAADLLAGQRPHLIGQFEFMTPPLAQRDFHVAFSVKGPRHRELSAAFNEGLAEITRDGTLSKIMNRHGLFPPQQKSGKKKRLVIGTVDNPDMKIMQSLSAEFEKQHPEIELEWRVLDESTLRLRLLSDLAISDGQFDIMTIGNDDGAYWAKRGWLLPFRPSANYDANDLLSKVRDILSHEGQLFALPFYAESVMTYYRKDLFAKAGLTMPARPTYEDLRKFAARIHDPAAGIYGACLRGKPGWGENIGLIALMANVYGGRWYDEKMRPQLDSPAWKKALAVYLDLQRYGPPNPDRNSFNENLALFSAGHCGIWVDATVAAGQLFDPKRSKVAAQLGYVAAPVAVTDKGATWLWTWALAIPNSSRHKKEATQFIEWATSKNYIQTVAKRYGWVAVPPGTRRSTYMNENYLKAAPFAPFVLNAIESFNVPESLPINYTIIPEFTAAASEVGEEMAKMLRGEQSADAALAKSQATLMEQMKRFGYLK